MLLFTKNTTIKHENNKKKVQKTIIFPEKLSLSVIDVQIVEQSIQKYCNISYDCNA